MAGENDDEDMADLFSFGSGEFGMESLEGSDSPRGNPPTNLPSAPAVSAAPFRSNSDDEFLDLLEDAPDLLSGPALATADHSHSHDAETQEILAWLDEEKPTVAETTKEETKKETTDAAALSTTEAATSSSPAKPTETAAPAPPPPPTETVVALPPVFKDLTSALASSQSTVGQIRRLAAEQLDDITHANRPNLFCRLLTGKSLNATQTQSSLVDAFTSWQTSEARKDEIAPRWMQLTCESLAERVAESLEKTQATHRDKEDCRQDLLDVLQYHERALPKSDKEESSRDWFIPPVAAALLGYSIPAPVASVLLSQIVGQHMPALALQSTERWEAAKGLHQHLYWLACYHLPLLVFHLDRYVLGAVFLVVETKRGGVLTLFYVVAAIGPVGVPHAYPRIKKMKARKLPQRRHGMWTSAGWCLPLG